MTKTLTEHQEQVLIFNWAEMSIGRYPMLKYMFSTLNGVRLTIGQATKAKRGGNKRGVPDIILPYNNGIYSGLWIELKVDKNKTSKEQRDYIEHLNSNGYIAVVAYGSKEAIDIITNYVKG